MSWGCPMGTRTFCSGPGAPGTLSLICFSAFLGCFDLSDSKGDSFGDIDPKPLQLASIGIRESPSCFSQQSQGRTLIGLIGSCDHPWTRHDSPSVGGL